MTDVNAWVALAVERHQHHATARDWFLSLGEQEAAFCRVTQMAFLRLLTRPAVMREDVLSPSEAWDRYELLRRDWRVSFAGEPSGIEQTWIRLMREAGSAASWTDAYLAAIALGHSFTLVTFDRGFRRWKSLPLLLLAP